MHVYAQLRLVFLDRGTWPEKDCNGGMQEPETLHCSSRFVVPGSHSQCKANNVFLSIPSIQEVSFLENGTIFLLTDEVSK